MEREDRQIIAEIQHEIVKACVRYSRDKNSIKPKHYIRALTRLLYEETLELFSPNND